MSLVADELVVRLYAPGDEAAVLHLINADRLPGQPTVTQEMLAEAVAGRSSVDSNWWKELGRPVTEVLHTATGEIVGVVSYASRPTDRVGVILWLHCQEEPSTAPVLIQHALGQLGHHTVHAFDFASALSLGLEGLPIRHRPATHAALTAAGFTGENLWRYMHAELPLKGLGRAEDVKTRPAEDGIGTQLEILNGRKVLAEATVGTPFEATAVLWWISVDPAVRGRGLGPQLLGSALDLMSQQGAKQVILYVDDDAPPGDPERDRAAANAMYDRAGLIEVDRLWSYRRETS
jgi:ribosomal protein S18 acetylase RimI-like enzyme